MREYVKKLSEQDNSGPAILTELDLTIMACNPARIYATTTFHIFEFCKMIYPLFKITMLRNIEKFKCLIITIWINFVKWNNEKGLTKISAFLLGKGYEIYDELVVPIIENTPVEADIAVSYSTFISIAIWLEFILN